MVAVTTMITGVGGMLVAVGAAVAVSMGGSGEGVSVGSGVVVGSEVTVLIGGDPVVGEAAITTVGAGGIGGWK